MGGEEPTRWDWWPLARLLTVVFVIGITGYQFGWRIDPGAVLALPRRVGEVLSFLTLVSFALAHLYVVLLMFPLYAAVTLNDTYYDLTTWTFRTIFRVRSGRALAFIGLAGEVVLFGATLSLLHRLLS
ncbi:hypothetical protein EPO15_09910 [bacterium]|nr:MAG: hypothetical protein EPO15_09910 [bacterium]